MIISTFNIQNDIKKYSKDKEKEIISYLVDNKIDILNLQEVYSKLDKDLSKDIDSLNYTMFGKYRFFLKRILNRINEKTPIITKYNVINNKTYNLPFLPSTLKRVMTKVEVEIDGKLVSIYNTHLDYMLDITRKRQLKRILKILRNDNNPIILTGDFNLKNNSEIFNNFVKEMKKLNINHIDVGDNTWKPSKYHRAIDHIFLSDNFKLNSKKIVKNIDISDHYPILINVDFK